MNILLVIMDVYLKRKPSQACQILVPTLVTLAVVLLFVLRFLALFTQPVFYSDNLLLPEQKPRNIHLGNGQSAEPFLRRLVLRQVQVSRGTTAPSATTTDKNSTEDANKQFSFTTRSDFFDQPVPESSAAYMALLVTGAVVVAVFIAFIIIYVCKPQWLKLLPCIDWLNELSGKNKISPLQEDKQDEDKDLEAGLISTVNEVKENLLQEKERRPSLGPKPIEQGTLRKPSLSEGGQEVTSVSKLISADIKREMIKRKNLAAMIAPSQGSDFWRHQVKSLLDSRKLNSDHSKVKGRLGSGSPATGTVSLSTLSDSPNTNRTKTQKKHRKYFPLKQTNNNELPGVHGTPIYSVGATFERRKRKTRIAPDGTYYTVSTPAPRQPKPPAPNTLPQQLLPGMIDESHQNQIIGSVGHRVIV